MCFLVSPIPFLANILEKNPKPKAPEVLANQTRSYMSFRFIHSTYTPS